MKLEPVRPGVFVLAVSAVVLSVVVGWSLGGRGEARGAESSLAKSMPSADSHTGRRYSGPPAAVREVLDRIRAAGSARERMRATIELAQTMPLEEYQKWIEFGWFDERRGFELTLFHRVGMKRWQREDPLGYVRWELGAGENEAGAVLARWVGGDSERLEEAFKEHRDPLFRLSVLDSVAVRDPGLALERLQKFVTEEGGMAVHPFSFGSILKELAERAPVELRAALEGLPSRLREQAERSLLAAELKRSFSDGFAGLLAHPKGLQVLFANAYRTEGFGENFFHVLGELPERWRPRVAEEARMLIGDSDPKMWFAADFAALGFDAKQSRALRTAALEQLAQNSPVEALALLDKAKLETVDRNQVISSVFYAANDDMEQAEEWASQLNDEEARAALQELIDGRRGQATETRERIETADAYLAHLTGERTFAGNPFMPEYWVPRWDGREIAALRERFKSLDESVQNSVASRFTSEQTYHFEERTAAWVGDALRHEVGRVQAGGNDARDGDLLGVASQHAVHWGLLDPLATEQWVDSLPDGDVQLWAQRNLAAIRADYDAEGLNRWMQGMSPERRRQVEAFVEARHDPNFIYVEEQP